MWNYIKFLLRDQGGWVGLAIAAGIGLYSVYKQSQYAKQATQAGVGASDRATQAELDMYYQSREDLAPWREAGAGALNKLTGMIEAGPGEFVPEEQPGYQFGYEEFVEKPTLRMASATGGLGGGGTQKALTRYASDYATQNYQNWLNNWYQSLTPYQSLAGLGQTSAGQTAQNALTTGQAIGSNIVGAGNARATGYVNQANIYGNAISGMGQNVLNYYMMNQMNKTPYNYNYSDPYSPYYMGG